MFNIISSNYKHLFKTLKSETAWYLNHYNLKSAIIGLSGGIDSAVVAAIVAGAKQDGLLPDDFMLRGYSLPLESNEKDEIARAQAVGKKYCDEFEEVNLSDPVKSMANITTVVGREWALQNEEYNVKKKIRLGNIKARVRMIFLYDMAHKYDGLVLSTDNYTEYNLGFWTLHGDVGDFGPVQYLWKTEVYRLAAYIGDSCLQDCIDAVPTDGLGITDSDIDQLLPNWEDTPRAGYEEIDRILLYQITTGGKYSKKELANRPILKRHFQTEFKRANGQSIPRETLVPNKMSYIPF
jgi:NAD+ synthetase